MSYTEIVCVIDKSGSMGSVTRDSINGFNEFLKQQQELPGEAKFTLILFDTNYNIICNGINIKDAEPLTNKTYVPSGFTALLDAVGKAIDSVGERLSNSLEKPSIGNHFIFKLVKTTLYSPLIPDFFSSS